MEKKIQELQEERKLIIEKYDRKILFWLVIMVIQLALILTFVTKDIIDFMNEVVNYRLDKEYFTISLDEIMKLADSFIVKYMANKKNKSLNLQKKVAFSVLRGVY